ncbi:hypothetical protein T439DRAFT_360013 [Meredithblackwellia eburnea MCA 4105]
MRTHALAMPILALLLASLGSAKKGWDITADHSVKLCEELTVSWEAPANVPQANIKINVFRGEGDRKQAVQSLAVSGSKTYFTPKPSQYKKGDKITIGIQDNSDFTQAGAEEETHSITIKAKEPNASFCFILYF